MPYRIAGNATGGNISIQLFMSNEYVSAKVLNLRSSLTLLRLLPERSSSSRGSGDGGCRGVRVVRRQASAIFWASFISNGSLWDAYTAGVLVRVHSLVRLLPVFIA